MTSSLFHRITSITMALLLLLSSTGFSMDIHYCQDQVKGISLLGKAKSCHEKMLNPPCHKAKKSNKDKIVDLEKTEKNSCCHNESLTIEKTDIDATNAQVIPIQNIQLDFIVAFISTYIFNYNVEADFQSFDQYKPPLPDRDIQVLLQTFLI